MPRGGELQLPTGSCSSPPPPEAGRYRPLGAVSTWRSIGAFRCRRPRARRRGSACTAGHPISFRPYRADPAELTSADLQEDPFLLPTPAPVL